MTISGSNFREEWDVYIKVEFHLIHEDDLHEFPCKLDCVSWIHLHCVYACTQFIILNENY